MQKAVQPAFEQVDEHGPGLLWYVILQQRWKINSFVINTIQPSSYVWYLRLCVHKSIHVSTHLQVANLEIVVHQWLSVGVP